MRLRSDIFVAALIRRAETQGAVAMLRRRGAAEAGTIFVKVDRLDGARALRPRAQSEEPPRASRGCSPTSRREWRDRSTSRSACDARSPSDPDIWIVEIEDRQGRAFIDLTA